MTHEVKENSSFERMQSAKPPFLDFVTMPFWSLSDVDRNKLCLGASSSYTFLIPPPTRALILVCKFVIIQIMRLYWHVRVHPVIIVCRIIEEEREVRRQRPQSFLGSDAKEDSKVTISHQRNYLHSKTCDTWVLIKETTSAQKWYPGSRQRKLPQLKSFLTLKVSLANSKAVFGLRVEPSRGALAQSSFPWQVVILATMLVRRLILSSNPQEFSGRPVSELFAAENHIGRAFLFFPMGMTMSRW